MRNFKTKYRGEASIVIIVVLATILVLGLITGLSSCTKVDSGCTGVRVQFGAVQETAFEAGLHFKTPFVEKVIEMNNKIQKVEVNAGSTSKDLQSVDSTLAVNYHLAKESSVNMYKNIGLSYEDTILQPAIQEATKSVMAAYRAEELIQRRGEVSIAIMDEIAKKVGDYGIIIDEFNITNFSFSQAFDDAIEQKLVAEQNLIKTETEQEQAKVIAKTEAEKKVIAANAEAEAILAQANAKAEAIEVEATAQAKANKELTESINGTLIEYNKIEKWNGQQPNVVGGGSGAIIVDATK